RGDHDRRDAVAAAAGPHVQRQDHHARRAAGSRGRPPSHQVRAVGSWGPWAGAAAPSLLIVLGPSGRVVAAPAVPSIEGPARSCGFAMTAPPLPRVLAPTYRTSVIDARLRGRAA